MNYEQYLEDYWPEEEESNDNTEQYEQYQMNYYGQVTNIDRQIAELQARRDALLHGYCFIGYVPSKTHTYIDPYNLDERFTNS